MKLYANNTAISPSAINVCIVGAKCISVSERLDHALTANHQHCEMLN